LMADVVYDMAQTSITVLDKLDYEEFDDQFADLEQEGAETLGEEGFTEDQRTLERFVEMRYLGQEHTVEVNANDVESLDELGQRFEERHETRYGHTMDDPPEVVHLRVRAIGENDKPTIEAQDPTNESTVDPIETREAYCFAEGAVTDFDVYEREQLKPGHELSGPAIIQEPTTTIVYHSDQKADIDEYGHILISEEV